MNSTNEVGFRVSSYSPSSGCMSGGRSPSHRQAPGRHPGRTGNEISEQAGHAPVAVDERVDVDQGRVCSDAQESRRHAGSVLPLVVQIVERIAQLDRDALRRDADIGLAGPLTTTQFPHRP